MRRKLTRFAYLLVALLVVACRSEFVTSSPAGWICVFPQKGPGICRIGADVTAQVTGEIEDGVKDAACDHSPFDPGKPKFDLVEP
jgi:hypothetical protein